MGFRRPPAEHVDLDLEQPAPNWLARQTWWRRWGQEHRGPLPESRAQSWRIIFNAGPLEPHLERARARWAELSEDHRRTWWACDDDRPGPECAPCPHHGGQALAYCPPSCPSVAKVQAAYDRANEHYWRTGAA